MTAEQTLTDLNLTPDVAPCELGLTGCTGCGALTTFPSHGPMQRCCTACGARVEGPDVLVMPVTSSAVTS